MKFKDSLNNQVIPINSLLPRVRIPHVCTFFQQHPKRFGNHKGNRDKFYYISWFIQWTLISFNFFFCHCCYFISFTNISESEKKRIACNLSSHKCRNPAIFPRRIRASLHDTDAADDLQTREKSHELVAAWHCERDTNQRYYIHNNRNKQITINFTWLKMLSAILSSISIPLAVNVKWNTHIDNIKIIDR